MSLPGPVANEALHCPLCGKENACALENGHASPCWCTTQVFPAALLARLPSEEVNRRCICRSCAAAAGQQSG